RTVLLIPNYASLAYHDALRITARRWQLPGGARGVRHGTQRHASGEGEAYLYRT
ncbi:hypothetical protein V495_07770, partial [Pseudogymnoascus sp. VKM F-4514 (FW-929)]